MYQQHSGSLYLSVENRNPWHPGVFRRLPVLGILALLGSLIGIAACTAILVYSDGKPIATWRFQPTVYLAIATALTNILLGFALSEGSEIAWWRKATKEKSTVGDLHRIWTHGRGFKDAIMAGRGVSLVAVACVLATIAQINGPLLQRASTVTLGNIESDVKLSFRSTSDLPAGYTGFASGRGYDISLYTPAYAPTVLNWNQNTAIAANGTGCSGICRGRVSALGLAVNCSQYTIPFNLLPSLENGELDVSAPSVQGIQVFNSEFGFNVRSGGNLTLKAIYKETNQCSGDLIGQICNLYTANVEYPVIIDGNKSTVAIDPDTDIFDDKIRNIVEVQGNNIQGPTTLGGFYRALHNKYYSNATMRFTGAVQYTIITEGNMALQYVVADPNLPDPYEQCNITFANPMTELLAGARELMFRTSLAASDATDPLQSVSAVQVQQRAVYRSNYYYLAGAIAVTIIATLSILLIFRGYAALGRSVTLSPIEVAKAFDAPVLRGSHDGNAVVEDLVRDVGSRSVRYGAMLDEVSHNAYPPSNPPQIYGGIPMPGAGVGFGSGMMQPTEYKAFEQVQETNLRRRLVMANEREVGVPEMGEMFSG